MGCFCAGHSPLGTAMFFDNNAIYAERCEEYELLERERWLKNVSEIGVVQERRGEVSRKKEKTE